MSLSTFKFSQIGINRMKRTKVKDNGTVSSSQTSQKVRCKALSQIQIQVMNSASKKETKSKFNTSKTKTLRTKISEIND